MNAVTPERVTLYYREGSSNKVYQAAIEPAGSQFVVNYAHGRRGGTLATGTKTSSPVDYDTARKIFTKLVNEKKNHPKTPYTEGENGTPYQHADKQPSGILPQLLNAIEEAVVEALLRDDNYCAQEKMDGHHKLIRKVRNKVEGINKKGFIVGLPEPIVRVVASMGGDIILDGEQIGDVFHMFDCLEVNSQNLRGKPYDQRMSWFHEYDCDLPDSARDVIKSVMTAFTTGQKTELWERLRRESREGIVFKRLDAPYVPGKPNSGGPQLKFKFVATVSAIVAKVNIKRSVEISLFKGRSLVSCGNVTIPANHEIPPAGAIVEVRYLYAYRDSLALYQPVYLGLRTDVDTDECSVSQLKYKAE
jgi:bifunctional non-homologous end joining protein LigD